MTSPLSIFTAVAVVTSLQVIAYAQTTNVCMENYAETLESQNGTQNLSLPLIQLYLEPSDEYLKHETDITFTCCFVYDSASSTTGWRRPTFETTGGQLSFSDADENFTSAVFRDRYMLNSQVDTATLSEENNGTTVHCQVQSTGPDFFNREKLDSQSRLLLVVGPPESPEPVFQVLSPDLIQLRWEPVPSVEAFPLTGYNIAIQYGDDNKIMLTTLNTVYNFTSPDGVDRNDCTEFKISVHAQNDIGESRLPSEVMVGFPKPTDFSSYDGVVKAEVLFNRDQMLSRLELSVEKPSVCPYETIQYSFVIRENGSEIFNISEGKEAAYFRGDMITVDIPLDNLIMDDTDYSAYAVLTTFTGGTIRTGTSNFSTEFTTEPTMLPSDPNLPYLSLGIVLGVGALLLVVLLLVVCILCIKKDRRRQLANMVDNPLYSGHEPVYDYVMTDSNTFRMHNGNGITQLPIGLTEIPLPISLKTADPELPPRGPTEPRYTSPSRSFADGTDQYVTMKSSCDGTS